MLQVIRTKNNLTVTIDGNTRTFSVGDPQHDECLRMWKNKELKELREFLSKEHKVIEKAKVASEEFSKFDVRDGVVWVNGRPVVDSLGKKIIHCAEENSSPERLINFWNRLVKNPSYWCVQSLFDFLDRNNCPIAEDGRFMCFKDVTNDFKDKRTRTINNSPGVKVPPFERNQVDDDKHRDYSFGYHVGSVSYVNRFGYGEDKFIEVLVDPEDVVSVPSDVSADKMRVCTYEVSREIKREDLDYNKYGGSYSTDEDSFDDEECGDCGELIDDCYCDEDDDDWD